MMTRWRQLVALTLCIALPACGGGGGGDSATGGTATGSQTGQGCSLVERQNWAFATLREWYLFPETLPAALDPAPYATVSDYIDALTATARGERRDRFFTYLTSIAQENAFDATGASAGFGFRLSTDAVAARAYVVEAFEGAAALNAGIDRGDEILAIGADANSLRNVSDIIAAEGTTGVTNAFGPTTAGTTRALKLSGPAGVRTVTVTKTDYSLTPVSPRYGATIIDDGGRPVAYLNLRTFITSAEPQLRAAFDSFRAAGVTDFIVDLRYNGGGLISTAELMTDLLGRDRFASQVADTTTYRPEKASLNTVHRFTAQPQSVAPARIAFIATGATASASELVINAFVPYLGANLALVGANSYGKPVGQVAIDRAACDDRLRVIAFAVRNGAGMGDYFDGLAATVGTTCGAGDDFTHPLGDAREASVRQALDFIEGKSCAPIATGQTNQSARAGGTPELLAPARPTAAQREVPGLF
ncbi:MAG: peptidase S41 [Sphingomonadaceae bacterium]|nr:peptidase S41 [Sphingomonadaceae bacterium]